MKKTLSELQAYLAVKRGFKQFSDMASHIQTATTDQLNILYELIWYHKQWGFAGAKMQFTTVPPYTTGTISGTAGSRTVTGSSTSWPSTSSGIPLAGQYMLVNGELHRILKVISTTSIMLEASLLSDVAAGSAYAIYFIEYPVRTDYGAFRDAQINLDPLTYRPESITPTLQEVGVPELIYNAGVTRADFASITGTLTNGSSSITSVSGVTVDDKLVGMPIVQVSLQDVYYIIDASGTTLFLDRPFQGVTAAATTILVGPHGQPLLGLKPFPTGRNLVQVNYTFAPPRLVGSTDTTLLPSDVPMLAGIDFLTVKWETVGEGNMNEAIFTDKKFMDSMKVLNFRGTPLQNKMFTKQDVHAPLIRRNTNPWNR